MSSAPSHTGLVVGAGGFIGRALVSALRHRRPKLALRTLARSPVGGSQVIDFTGDAHDPLLLQDALDGVDTAWYLVHGLADRGAARHDPAAAERFARQAARAGVRHLVCVGALGVDLGKETPHVSSRRAVAAALRTHGVPVTELRCAVVLGQGSAVVELFRRIIERFWVLPVPHGAQARVQPIALADLVDALVQAHDGTAAIQEIGGPEVVTWRAFLEVTAELLQRHRPAFQMPFATPRLSGLFMSAFGPFSPAMGESFVRGLGHDAVVGPGGRTTHTPLRAALATALGVSEHPPR